MLVEKRKREGKEKVNVELFCVLVLHKNQHQVSDVSENVLLLIQKQIQNQEKIISLLEEIKDNISTKNTGLFHAEKFK